jgi:hypothetical protein
VALALLAGGCSIAGGAPATPQTVSGIVIAANGPDSATVNTFTLRTSDGQVINFTVGTLDVSNGLPAPHLREHLVNGEPITVTYHLENGALVATRYVDAAPSEVPSATP